MGSPVVHFELTSKAAPALQEFYSNIFGWTISRHEATGYGMADTGAGEGINGGIAAGPEGTPEFLTIYIQVDDPDAILKAIEAKGGKTLLPTMSVPDGPTIAHFQDPAGFLVGLIKAS